MTQLQNRNAQHNDLEPNRKIGELLEEDAEECSSVPGVSKMRWKRKGGMQCIIPDVKVLDRGQQ
jgi:hypothetical protein